MASKVSPAESVVKTSANTSDNTALKQQQQQPPLDSEEMLSCAENPVGRLQEQCQKRLWPMPVYTYECTNGDDPALRQFTCTVALPAAGRGLGVGRSKRLAKRQAAAALLQRVLTTATDDSAQPQMKPTPPPAPAKKQKKTQTRSPSPTSSLTLSPARQKLQTPSPAARSPTSSPLDEASFHRLCTSKRLQSAAKAGAEIGGIFRGVRNRKAGSTLPPISPPSSGTSACEQLTELGKAHRFGVVFLVDGAAAATGGHRSVVKLCTMPTIVAVGNGPDAAASREEASRAAMDYLCLLTQENAANTAAKK